VSWDFYIDRQSRAHRLHPATRMITVLLLFLSAVLLKAPSSLALLCLLVLLCGFASGCQRVFAKFSSVLLLITFLCFLMWLTLDWSRLRGTDAPTILSIPKPALLHAITVSLRLLSMLLGGLVLFATTPPEEILLGLCTLKVPFPIAFSVTLAARLFPVFLQRAYTILDAQRSRGLQIKGNPIKRTLAFIPLIVPVFISSLSHIQRLSLALEARGFRPGAKRTFLRQRPLCVADFLAITLASALLAIAILSNLT